VSIRLNADVLAMNELTPDDARSVQGIKQSVERLNDMMRELLDFAGGSARAIERKPTDLEPWLEDIDRFWTANLATMRVEFRLEDDYHGVWSIDAPRLRRVLDNLIKNAQSVVRPGGTITLRTAVLGTNLRIQVQDTGTGIPPALHETLFQPFVTHGKKEGTGLGLAICKTMVERHGGTIGFTSSSEGTTFTMMIPQAPVAELQEATA
jgi:signal transduction histidine kinase